jgi:prepilin-type N-terminal cleavage/methylation domain-containing protein
VANTNVQRVGFTLIEVLVALVILSLGIVAVLRGMNSAAVALGASGETLRTEALSDDLMSVIALGLSVGSNAPPSATGRFTEPYEAYQWEWEQRSLPIQGATAATASQTLHEVTVSVWRNETPDRRRTKVRWVYGFKRT